MKKTKTLGILGGMGPMASALLYEKITTNTQASCDQDHLNILLYSHASLPDRSCAIQSQNTQEIQENLINDLVFLEKMGANVLAIPCNTSHYFYQEMANTVKVPLLNMVSLTCDTVAENSYKKVAILATEGTIYSGIYQKELQSRGIAVLEMPCHLQERVNQLIYQEIKEGKPGNRENFLEIETYLRGQEVDQILLACTELSVFATQTTLSPLYTDALEILCKEAILSCGASLKERITP